MWDCICISQENITVIIVLLQGDSGGPVQIRKVHNTGFLYHIVGVTSFGVLCGSSAPGVYTRVSSYISWIEKEVWLN